MKKIILAIVALAVLVGVFYGFNSYIYNEKQADTGSNTNTATDHKNAEYLIDGQRVKLIDGMAETEVAPGSASKMVTQYFGNELVTDLDGDGDDDIAFILTQTMGGTGTFYYAVAALNTPNGYIGSDGYLLGDRIAPQTTEVSQNPRHKNVVVFNYAERKFDEPMSAQPSVGKSAYLKLDSVSMQWGIVEPNFEGEGTKPEPIAESWGTIIGTVMLGPTCPVVMDPPDPSCMDKPYETRLAITTADQSRVLKEVHSDVQGKFRIDLPAGTYSISGAAAANILPYCSVDRIVVPINETVEVTVYCDSGIR